ncbi:hypothetical protein WJX77_001098 [Trebouxia sp. C0004]
MTESQQCGRNEEATGRKLLRVRNETQSLVLPPLELTDAERNEVEAVVNFYEELCQIAQVLKAVDPFCMLFMQQVKQGLEAGVSLRPVLLTSSLNEVAKFARETGMQTHLVPRLLPLCTFVRKSVQLQEHHLLHHVQQLGVTQLLYTPDQLQALAVVSNPGKHGQGHAKLRWSQIRDTTKRVAAGQHKSTDALQSNIQPECAGVAGTQRSHMQQSNSSALSGSVSMSERDLV